MSNTSDLERRTFLSVLAVGAGAAALPAAAQSGAAPAASGPMDMNLPARLVHVFDIRIDFLDRKVAGPLPWGGQQGYTSVKSGLVAGPMLNGRVVDQSGADWATVRADGVVVFNAHYLLEADDGTMIYINNRGYSPSADAVAGSGSPDFAAPPGMRFSPVFTVPKGPHDWLTRTVIVGIGERKPDPDHSIFRYYAWL